MSGSLYYLNALMIQRKDVFVREIELDFTVDDRRTVSFTTGKELSVIRRHIYAAFQELRPFTGKCDVVVMCMGYENESLTEVKKIRHRFSDRIRIYGRIYNV